MADNDLALGPDHRGHQPQPVLAGDVHLRDRGRPADGWDHVSGFRTTAYVASPYTRRGVTVSTQYNQTSLLRTMELMLGLPPMNQLDATATPMSDCFTNTPDFTPYVALPNNIPLDQMNPEPKDRPTRSCARTLASARLPLDKPDQCPEDLLNRILWHAMKGPKAPYPAWATPGREDD